MFLSTMHSRMSDNTVRQVMRMLNVKNALGNSALVLRQQWLANLTKQLSTCLLLGTVN